MMALFFRDRGGTIDELEGLPEIREAEYAEEMVIVRDFPIGDLSVQFQDRIALERWDAATAGHAGLIG